ncbi:hypothetical protein SAY86_018114 [Trapa natans]|uniref:ZF-HD dimerization-type domain-containing protein n=1 Tax=Trapa natans TaxID=22666 RepID=A0AAN7LCT3_TRANT|nr:hypothetical protein SAY86_018114 [Trapa natans]
MDLTATPTNTTSNTTTTTTNTVSTRSPDQPDPDTPTRVQALAKSLSFTNGALNRHSHQTPPPPPPAPQGAAVTYRECLKNHAASRGGHALDGCGEFMPSPTATDADPTSIRCAACGCHRNFHRRDPEVPPGHPTAAVAAAPAPPSNQVIEYQSHHRHLPPPPPPPRSPESASPPPISSSYYGHPVHSQYPHHHLSVAPHVLLSLSNAAAPADNSPHPLHPSPVPAAFVSPISRKRFRTKFTQLQKERMFELAEKVGWKMQKRDDEIIREFCHEIGVERGVLKVWMHNNKNTLGKKSSAATTTGNDININSSFNASMNMADQFPTRSLSLKMKDEPNGGGYQHHHDCHNHDQRLHCHLHVGTNGSSSS